MNKKKLLVLACISFLLFFLLISCLKKNSVVIPQPTVYSQEEWLEKEISLILSRMSQQEKASQVLMTGIDGKKSFLNHSFTHFADSVPGAILLFRYNLADTPQEVIQYLESCNSAFSKLGSTIPVFFAIDNEGGSVFRSSGITSALPSAKKVAELFSPVTASQMYIIQGQQLKALGISMNLAPVAEILNNENSFFLGTRSYGIDPQKVVAYSISAINAYRKSKILSVVKHFPGNTSIDPHLQLPKLNISQEAFERNFISSFTLLFSSVPVDALLVSHIVVPILDPNLPFCLSRLCVTDYLRGNLDYSGLIITDDISMPALANSGFSSSQAAIMAIKAGCDMVMTSATDIHEIIYSIKSEADIDINFSKRLDSAVYSILAAKFKTAILFTSLQKYQTSRHNQIENVVSFNSEKYKKVFDLGNLLVEEMYEGK